MGLPARLDRQTRLCNPPSCSCPLWDGPPYLAFCILPWPGCRVPDITRRPRRRRTGDGHRQGGGPNPSTLPCVSVWCDSDPCYCFLCPSQTRDRGVKRHLEAGGGWLSWWVLCSRIASDLLSVPVLVLYYTIRTDEKKVQKCGILKSVREVPNVAVSMPAEP